MIECRVLKWLFLRSCRYKRVFSVGTHGITTYNPTTLEVTNQWPYGDICGIAPVGKGQGTEFNLTFRKGSGKKSETLKFSTEHRTELLTEALRFRTDFSEGKITGRRYNCFKHHWSDARRSVCLEVTPGGIDQIDPQWSNTRRHSRLVYLVLLSQHPSMAIVKGAGLIMKAIIEEGDKEIASKMQELALSEGALPRHLHTSMFTISADQRMLTNRQLSRHLVGLWTAENSTALNLLKRILPTGLLAYLDSSDPVPEKDMDRMHIRDNVKIATDQFGRNKVPEWQRIAGKAAKEVEKFAKEKADIVLLHWRDKMGIAQKEDRNNLNANQRPVILRKRRQRIKIESNWELFYYKFQLDHARSNLIWNLKTREELRDALEAEMRSFGVDRELGSASVISWNHQEFEVKYECLSDEIKIGDYYLRLLLEEDESEESGAIKRSYEFFNELYHRFLLTPKVAMKCLCLQALTIVYGKCCEEIGPFADTKYIVGMLDRCTDKLERDRLILFLNKLILNKKNVKDTMDSNGVRILVDLLTLAHLHTNRATVPLDQDNAIIRPLPKVKRLISDSTCLPHIVQLLLTFDPILVEKVANLLYLVMQDNPNLQRLYLTGVFFFIMMYTGSNVLPVARFLKYTHLKQAFKSEEAKGQDIVQRSVLGSMLPEAMVCYLENYEAERFSEIFLGEFDTPEAIWSSEMRSASRMMRDMFEKVNKAYEFLCTKSARIVDGPDPENIILILKAQSILFNRHKQELEPYKYAGYPMLIKTINMETGDGQLFSKTSALLPAAAELAFHTVNCSALNAEELRRENGIEVLMEALSRCVSVLTASSRPEDMAVQVCGHVCRCYSVAAQFEECREKIVELPNIIRDVCHILYYSKLLMHDESKIRKAYFRLAQKYHPDKNPEGRDMFEKVNKAYEFLCTKSARIVDGPDPENIILILKAQSILFNRHKQELEPYKYAGYPMLIKTITMETGDGQLFSKTSALLPAAAELAFHTVNCSALNAEELRRENGIEVLMEALSRCVSVLTASSRPEDMAVQVCGHVCRCYSVAAQFEECREKIVELPNIIRDVCHILYYSKGLPRLASLAVECVSSFAVDFFLQTHLYRAGVLWHLLFSLFSYDYTLEESGVQASQDTNQQQVCNSLAKLSVGALGRLAGYSGAQGPEDQPSGGELPPENPSIRKSLGAMLTPYISRRLSRSSPAEVLKLLNSNSETPYLIWNNGTRAELMEFLEEQQESNIKRGECDKSFGSEFLFSEHGKELIVGEIFVRVYNEQPAFPLEYPKAFASSLLDYVGSQAQYLHTLLAMTQTNKVESQQHAPRLRWAEMALEALRNVIKNNPGSETECIGHFKLLFSLLRVHGAGRVQQLALEVVNTVTSNQDCVVNIAESLVLPSLLVLLHSLPSSRQLVLETLYALTSNTKIITEAMNRGALIYLLDLFCNSTHPQVRTQTAELFSKMTSDKLVGPKVRLTLMRFLPAVFMDAMRDNPEAAVHIFEGTHENPELIWNDSSRETVSTSVREMMLEHFKQQKDNPDVSWKLAEDFSVAYGAGQGELEVGGVFLRIYQGEALETVSTAAVCLFSSQTQLADQVPPLGHLPRVLTALNHKNNAVPKSAIRLIHVLSDNELCVRSMAALDTIGPLMTGMKLRADMAGLACEALNRMFQREQTELVAQALRVDLVPYLLKLLEGVGLETLENPSATKAQIVKALKSMTRSLQFGEQVNEILSRSTVWSAFKDQKHDLFISDSQTAGYLTGPGVAGYLTAGSGSTVMPSVPPPVDKDIGDLG
ncbi:dnaJ homolog subfamily C member 13-like [Sinocyclocheilus rhinocerous]|uniref:dnaJ homolog subfamily C member 13-like n=1 Tax=Sinocyclocheilus rhinocerous TaxID=307959 RepID=UPI0007BAA0DF|nr:PREDICTED: dnaJ homolog subfamily C member 13-like [Sinocyclocheilus rhinocerous]